MQLVILAGGLATRIRPLTEDTPKSLIPIAGEPFIAHQLRLVRASGVRRIVLCIGHLGQHIRDYVGDGAQFGVHVEYSDEGASLRGTGGALRLAMPLLDDPFMLMWGDSYLKLDYADVYRRYDPSWMKALMVVYRNRGQGDASNVDLAGDRVARYDKWSKNRDYEYIDNGLSVIAKSVVERIPPDQPSAIEAVYRDLAAEGILGAYVTTQRFFEVGSFQGIDTIEAELAGGSSL